MAKELDMIEPAPDNIWRGIVTNLIDNPGAVQPVRLINPNNKNIVATFRASLVDEGGKTYFQIEDLDPVEFAERFLEISQSEWEIHIRGIYRLPIS